MDKNFSSKDIENMRSELIYHCSYFCNGDSSNKECKKCKLYKTDIKNVYDCDFMNVINSVIIKAYGYLVSDNNNTDTNIADSGDRTVYSTGACRDMKKGKGRFDYMPLDVLSYCLYNEDSRTLFEYTNRYIKTGDYKYILSCINLFSRTAYLNDPEIVHSSHDASNNMIKSEAHAFLELAKHFENGADKYGPYNWQLGIPTYSYIDSACRHYMKFLRGDTDERHDRAFLWNLVCCVWTCINKPDLNSFPIKKSDDYNDSDTDIIYSDSTPCVTIKKEQK